MNEALYEKHRKTLDDAIRAIHERTFFSAYPELPSGRFYGDNARDEGLAAFKGYLNQTFELDQPGDGGTVGSESSPYGFALGVRYPRPDVDALLRAAEQAIPAWRDARVEARLGVCLEILHRLNRRSFEIANAVMHTTGQGFMLAFQAGGPHAQDRGLEALAYAAEEMRRTPRQVTWSKQVARDTTVTLRKTYHIVPRGVALVIGCSTFPTWNGYPGLFASLATGNAVVVKPHPGAVLPLAITVRIARDVLGEQGFDPDLVALAADEPGAPLAKELARRPQVRIIDYTGSSAFGDWLEQNARQAVVFTEKAGVNSIILDSADDLKAVAANIAFSLSLYSGQMCTTPQNIFVPRDGIRTGDTTVPFDEVCRAIVAAVDGLLSDAKRAADILGAIQNERTVRRVEQAAAEGLETLRPSTPIRNETFPEARTRSPLILKADARDADKYMREMFGPISYIVATEGTPQSIEQAAECARRCGAITCGVYSTDQAVLHRAEQAMVAAGVPVSCNLTGPIWVNQSAAFSDFHVSGANPSGNATLTDGAFVADRFRVVQTRVPAADAG